MLPREYFKDSELCCKCGCGMMPKQKSVERLYALRIALGLRMKINSAARCKKRNAATPGAAPNSAHLHGQGFDVEILDREQDIDFIPKAQMCGFTGFGLFIDNYKFHIDDYHDEITIWTYNK